MAFVRDINEIQTLVAYIIRLERGAFQTFEQVDSALHMSQMDFFEERWDDYMETGVLPHELEVFKSRFTFSYATSPNGIVDQPSDYGRWLNGYTITLDNVRGIPKRNKITPINEIEVVNALNSQVRPVSPTYPLMVKGASSFVLYPQQPMAGEMNYLITPLPPVFGYTQVGRVVTYNPLTSVQLLWDDMEINDIILGALQYMGINLNDKDITAFGEAQQAAIN